MAVSQKSAAQQKSFKRFHWLRWLLLGLLAAVAYDVMTGPSGLLNLRQLAKQNADKRAGLDSMARKRDDLTAEKKRLTSDSSYLEAVARRELGMAKPGEKVYRFESQPETDQAP
jgi:cell division protein FtsB